MKKHKIQKWILPLMFLISLLIAGQVFAQQSARFVIEQVDTGLFPQVEAYLSVSDAQGYPVRGLTKDNFTVFEDGSQVNDFEITPIQNIQQPLSFVLLMDTSGSMEWGTPAPLSNAVSAAKSFVDTLSTQDQVAIVTFDSQINVVQGLTSEKTPASSALDLISAEGDTALYDGIVEAVGLLKDTSHRKVVILITDGIESGISEFTFDQAVNEAARWSVPVYPIGFGAVDETELTQLAQLTGGLAQIQPDSSTLQASFTTIQQVLREQYLLRYNSSIPADALEHTLSAKVDFQTQHLEAAHQFMAQPGELSVTMPDFDEGQTVGGKIRFAPEILGPAPVSSMQINMDGELLDQVPSAPFQYDWDAGTVFEGPHEFTFIVEDTAGNVGEFSIMLNVKPAVTVVIDSLTRGDELSVTTTLSATVDSQAGIAKVEFYIDDELIDTRESVPYQTDWLVEDAGVGEHEIKVIAIDAAGNSSQAMIPVIVRPPIIVTFTELQDGDLLRGSPEIGVAVDAMFAVDEVLINADGRELASFTSPPYSVQWPLYNVDPGQYVISVEVRDVDGHIAQVEVTVDVNRAGVQTGDTGDETGSSGIAGGAVESVTGGLGVWIAVIVALALAGVLIPIALRKRRTTGGVVAGSGAAVLHEVQGNSPGKKWPLTNAEIKMGRKRDENDIHLKGLKASRRMAVIRMHEGDYVIYSLSPDNPVVVNGSPIAQQHTLQLGDTILMGESEFRYEA